MEDKLRGTLLPDEMLHLEHEPMQTNIPCWSVAIFAARESIATLKDCVCAVLGACMTKDAVVDVLVNGNRPLAEEAAQLASLLAPGSANVSVRVWFIPVGDKAHAWNEYIHRIWQSGETVYFIDGYAVVRPDALALMDAGLRGAPEALGATGVPTCGRSADELKRRLLKEGGIHGNLYAIRGAVITALKESKFRMPLGLYRTDSLIGAVLMFRLDPAQYGWDTGRMLVHPQATWYVAPTIWWTPKDVVGQFKRKLRQAQGVLENRAVRKHLAENKFPPQSLPKTVNELVSRWIADHSQEAKRTFMKQPLTLHAARKLQHPRGWPGVDSRPVLMATVGPNAGGLRPVSSSS